MVSRAPYCGIGLFPVSSALGIYMYAEPSTYLARNEPHHRRQHVQNSNSQGEVGTYLRRWTGHLDALRLRPTSSDSLLPPQAQWVSHEDHGVGLAAARSNPRISERPRPRVQVQHYSISMPPLVRGVGRPLFSRTQAALGHHLGATLC